MTSIKLNKKLFSCTLIVLLIAFISCGEKRFFQKNNNGKIIDKRLVGTWEGSESNTLVDGMSSEWKMLRKSNGSFILDAIVNIDGEITEYSELGFWWVENGLFYELHNDSKKTDIYYYEVLNKKQIKFKANKMAFEVFKEDYEFIDTKISN